MTNFEIIETLFREAIEEIKVPCPECGGTYFNEEYTCGVCWCEGGNGEIKVSEFFEVELNRKNQCF